MNIHEWPAQKGERKFKINKHVVCLPGVNKCDKNVPYIEVGGISLCYY